MPDETLDADQRRRHKRLGVYWLLATMAASSAWWVVLYETAVPPWACCLGILTTLAVGMGMACRHDAKGWDSDDCGICGWM